MADMSINSFKANFLGGARPTLFEVEMTFPAGVSNSNMAAKKMKFTCTGAAIPANSVGKIDVNFRGRKIPIPGDRTFSEMSLTVLNDVDWQVRNAFEEWMALINTHEGNIGNTTLSSVTSDFQVKQLNRDGSVVKTYKLISCFPSALGEITLSGDSNDSIETFTITIQYAYWQTETIV